MKSIVAKGENGKPMKWVNEIEIVDEKYLYGNVFLKDDIYKFNKETGETITKWDM